MPNCILDLRNVSFDDPSTTITIIGIALDARPAQCWRPGDSIPPDVIEAYNDPECAYVSHGDFDPYGIERIARPQFGWPLFPPHRRINTVDDLHILGW
jgi:hypothetical protein